MGDLSYKAVRGGEAKHGKSHCECQGKLSLLCFIKLRQPSDARVVKVERLRAKQETRVICSCGRIKLQMQKVVLSR